MRTSVVKMAAIALLPAWLFHFGCATEPRPATARPMEPAAQEAGAQEATETRRVIRPDRFPTDQPYSFGVLAGETLYLSGQLGRDPSTGEQAEGIAAQTRQAMENIGQVLHAAGMDYANLVKCHVYLNDMEDYTGMNEVYGSFFAERVPARTTVEAVGLPRDVDVQITCLAYADLSRISVVRPPEGSLPAPLGPYSAAVWAGDTLYLSGMGGQFPKDRRLPEGLGEQVTQTLVNVGTTMDAAEVDFADVVSTHVYVTVPEEIDELAPAYDPSFASTSAPPRGLLFLPRLPGEIKAEITVVAARPSDDEPATLYTGTASAPDAGPEFEDQFRAVLDRLGQTLDAAELAWRHVAHVQVSLTDLDDTDYLNQIFQETFPDDPPARTTIQVLPADGARVHAALVATR